MPEEDVQLYEFSWLRNEAQPSLPPASTWKLLGPAASERHELQQRAIHIPATGRPGVTFPFIRLDECMLEGCAVTMYGNPKFFPLVVRPVTGTVVAFVSMEYDQAAGWLVFNPCWASGEGAGAVA